MREWIQVLPRWAALGETLSAGGSHIPGSQDSPCDARGACISINGALFPSQLQPNLDARSHGHFIYEGTVADGSTGFSFP